MRNLKFLEMYGFKVEKAHIIANSKELAATRDALDAAITQLLGLMFLLPNIVGSTANLRSSLNSALKQVAAARGLATPHGIENDPEVAKLTAAIYHQQGKAIHDSEEAILAHLKFNCGFIDKVSSFSPDANSAIGALMSGMLVSSWTLFEACVTDAWTDAVNGRPKSLARLALDASVADDDGMALDTESVEIPKAGKALRPRGISAERLRQWNYTYGFSIGDKVGSLVRWERRGAFNRLDGLRAYYRLTFGKPADDEFAKHYDQLAILEALRNVIVHRGGKIDQPFLDRVSRTQSLAGLGIGDDVPIDGAMFSEKANAAAIASVSLLKFVDNWLITNPE